MMDASRGVAGHGAVLYLTDMRHDETTYEILATFMHYQQWGQCGRGYLLVQVHSNLVHVSSLGRQRQRPMPRCRSEDALRGDGGASPVRLAVSDTEPRGRSWFPE